jgi:anti-sigma regulatory factor (Ser/Thr protein kinase)
MQPLSLRVPSDTASLTRARLQLARWLDEISVPADVTFGVVTACSEAISNAIEHAEEPREPFVDVEADRDGDVVSLRVRDYGRWREPRLGTDRNHGLLLISGLMTDVQIRRSEQGTTVAMRLDLAEQATARRTA